MNPVTDRYPRITINLIHLFFAVKASSVKLLSNSEIRLLSGILIFIASIKSRSSSIKDDTKNVKLGPLAFSASTTQISKQKFVTGYSIFSGVSINISVAFLICKKLSVERTLKTFPKARR